MIESIYPASLSHILGPTELPVGCADDLKTTELSNSDRFVDQFGPFLRYMPARKSWFVYDGSRWQIDELGFVSELAKRIPASIYAEAGRSAHPGGSRQFGDHARSTATRRGLRNMVELATSDPRVVVRPQDFDRDALLLNVANGRIDLRSGDLREHSADDLLAKVSPVVHDPEASCPLWDSFLDDVTCGDPDLKRFLAQLAGYCLTGDTSEQAFFVLHGSGANGKSVFLHVLQRLLAEYAATADFETFLDGRGGSVRNDLASFVGARLVLCSEIGVGKRLDETVVKQVTGGDYIRTRYLYHEFFQYLPQFKLVLATNHLPLIVGDEDGIWRRPRVIPFDARIAPERMDKGLKEKLEAELPGILNWALDGCRSWMRGGLSNPRRVDEATRAYRKQMDTVHAFVEEECVADPDAREEFQSLYAGYKAWCGDGGRSLANKTVFGLRLNGRFESYKNSRGYMARKGIRLKTAADRVEPAAEPSPIEPEENAARFEPSLGAGHADEPEVVYDEDWLYALLNDQL